MASATFLGALRQCDGRRDALWAVLRPPLMQTPRGSTASMRDARAHVGLTRESALLAFSGTLQTCGRSHRVPRARRPLMGAAGSAPVAGDVEEGGLRAREEGSKAATKDEAAAAACAGDTPATPRAADPPGYCRICLGCVPCARAPGHAHRRARRGVCGGADEA